MAAHPITVSFKIWGSFSVLTNNIHKMSSVSDDSDYEYSDGFEDSYPPPSPNAPISAFGLCTGCGAIGPVGYPCCDVDSDEIWSHYPHQSFKQGNCTRCDGLGPIGLICEDCFYEYDDEFKFEEKEILSESDEDTITEDRQEVGTKEGTKGTKNAITGLHTPSKTDTKKAISGPLTRSKTKKLMTGPQTRSKTLYYPVEME